MSSRKKIVAKEIRALGAEDLKQTLKLVEDELFKSRLKKATNQLEDVMLIRKGRRDIARIKMVMAEQRAKPSETVSK